MGEIWEIHRDVLTGVGQGKCDGGLGLGEQQQGQGEVYSKYTGSSMPDPLPNNTGIQPLFD